MQSGSLSSDEEDVRNEQLAFDSFLNQLGSGSDEMASLYKKRLSLSLLKECDLLTFCFSFMASFCE